MARRKTWFDELPEWQQNLIAGVIGFPILFYLMWLGFSAIFGASDDGKPRLETKWLLGEVATMEECVRFVDAQVRSRVVTYETANRYKAHNPSYPDEEYGICSFISDASRGDYVLADVTIVLPTDDELRTAARVYADEIKRLAEEDPGALEEALDKAFKMEDLEEFPYPRRLPTPPSEPEIEFSDELRGSL